MNLSDEFWVQALVVKVHRDPVQFKHIFLQWNPLGLVVLRCKLAEDVTVVGFLYMIDLGIAAQTNNGVQQNTLSFGESQRKSAGSSGTRILAYEHLDITGVRDLAKAVVHNGFQQVLLVIYGGMPTAGVQWSPVTTSEVQIKHQ
ncbi:hypothetical protein C8J57DRAFT_1243935 [Mycena rebaudengoi]|nr:hypothetical protein C8J57DRAFT_1247780 [Mycena rebaudengoi]KAJ7242728.1 hypothetical protein C8J57DRAFT_1243935 [Mycena rebaudengoi]